MAPVRLVRRLSLALVALVALTILVARHQSLSLPLPGNLASGYPFRNVVPDVSSQRLFSWANVPMANPDTDPIPLLNLPTDKLKFPRIQDPSLANPEDEASDRRKERERRRDAVKDVFKRSWESYRAHAWLHDEVRPVSNGFDDPFGGWAATLVDSLDTLWIMGMKSEFEEALASLDKIDFSRCKLDELSVFETTIRYLGGFLGAYDVSQAKYPVLLEKATEVGEMLYHAFDTPNHMPVARWNWRDAKEGVIQKAERSMLVAELGSLSMEFTRLTQLTGNVKFFSAVQRISLLLHEKQNTTVIPGLWPITVDAESERFNSDTVFTWGGMADSVFEYLPKMHLLLAGADDIYKDMWSHAAAAAKKYLAFEPALPKNSEAIKGLNPLFLGTAHGSRHTNFNFDKEAQGLDVSLDEESQHLTCFAGGAFALASRAFGTAAEDSKAAEDLDVGERITDGCVWSYRASPSGIGPEIFSTIGCRKGLAAVTSGLLPDWTGKGEASDSNSNNCELSEDDAEKSRLAGVPPGFVVIIDSRYILRPEAIESVFVLWRTTGNQKWADAAWDMFEAIVRHTRTTGGGHAAINDVMNIQRERHITDDDLSDTTGLLDSCESFWTAETLKYFYLVFSDANVISLDEYVLNTEAHPFRWNEVDARLAQRA